jgi:tetratricopeptide (TPR) repeat protein/tRNA A-37 threonylcarbamoyl transferase component Bud32
MSLAALEPSQAESRLPGEVTTKVDPGPATEGPGSRIGRYKLLQKIGEGGCGIVYMAEQEEPVQRRVALKVIKLGMDTKQVIARFEAERQALAMMEHPNIAKVLDAGSTENGRPYFVMELVRGIKITDYCDQNNLSTEQRLDLFMQVCRAIQHAHQKGIIHRDIKPSNILVTLHDGVPVPKVIDFGIAKATQGKLTDQTLFTAFEQFIGTPAYMSPEQAEMSGLDIDTRTDIYSLGVLLYELLTGRTPFDPKELLAAGLDALRQTIREKEPVRPSTRLSTMLAADLSGVARHRQSEPGKLASLIRGDLDWIVMKALEKDRTRRYETANSLAMDLERYLKTEPVVACPPSQWYRFQKLVRRNKLAFGAVTAVMVALVCGLGLATYGLVQARVQRNQARASEKRAQGQKQAAEEARGQALKSAGLARSEAAKSWQVAQLLKDMLKSVGPSVAMGRDTTLLKEILDQTAERLGTDLKGQPEVEAELRTTIGMVYEEMDDYVSAEEMLRAALKIRRELPEAEFTASRRLAPASAIAHHHSLGWGDEAPTLAASLFNLGRVRLELQDLAGAKALLEGAVQIDRKRQPPNDTGAAACLHWLAICAMNEGYPARAEPLLQEALSIRKQLSGGEDADVAETLMACGQLYYWKGELAQAEASKREAITMQRRVLGDNDAEVLVSLFELVPILVAERKLADAESTIRDALQGFEKLGGLDLEVIILLERLAYVLGESGEVAAQQEVRHRLEAVLRRHVATARESRSRTPARLRDPVWRLSSFLVSEGRYLEAEQMFAEVLTPEIINQPEACELLHLRGRSRARTGHWKEAAADFLKAVELKPQNPWYYHSLVRALLLAGQRDACQDVCGQMRTRFRDAKDAITADWLAQDCLMVASPGRDLATEAAWAETAVTVGEGHFCTLHFQFCKGLLEYRRSHFESAVDWMQRVLLGTSSSNFYALTNYYGETYSWPGLRVKSRAILAMAQQQLNRTDEARSSLAKGLEVAGKELPKLDCGDLGACWADCVMAHSLLREAEALIQGEASASGETKPGDAAAPRKEGP